MRGIAVIVVACDSGPLLAECVQRALADTACAELIVVDNDSHDGSLAAVAALNDMRLRIEPMGRNAGFSVACNRGAAVSQSPYLMFLNPDALVESQTLSVLRSIAEAHPEIGLLGADVRDAHGVPEAAARRRDPTVARLLRTQWARWLGGQPDGDGVTCARTDEPVSTVDATSGALMLVPRAVFARIGGFDESFFLHAEDLDLCRRVRAAGWRVAVANQVPVTHVQGTSSRARPFRVIWHKHRSLWRYFVKHEGLRPWTPTGLGLLILLTSRTVAQCVAQPFKRR